MATTYNPPTYFAPTYWPAGWAGRPEAIPTGPVPPFDIRAVVTTLSGQPDPHQAKVEVSF